MHQKTCRQQPEQHRLLGDRTCPPQGKIQTNDGTGAYKQPEEIPAVKHGNVHITHLQYGTFERTLQFIIRFVNAVKKVLSFLP